MQSQQQKLPVTEVFSHIEVADGRIWLKPDGIGYFAGDLPEAEQKVVWATQAVPVPDLFNQKVDGVGLVEAELVHCRHRRSHRSPRVGTLVAKRMGATIVELRSSHRPDALSAACCAGRDPQRRKGRGIVAARSRLRY